ncbi:hypothetical protein CLAFUW4_04872 [Fulvia fulva]|uniref:Uncharacterized protein n=1 Tax=Passalora fulva TaxID=5499 RepID=A0A9Q8PHR5_PASFU|nr:uncharacterized protein CLAFUR5_12033 [Fulvia fulva]KAK4626288.1 hypothetical protein CLAFUR4_04858 [Fulvia fulva]KAK4627579.1 hypothetical protein CLAFUR0_04862 [Fulvia fulva]UJO22637.1 hypothetical protein CLAFUR5_12033 [Fulvia fulva]WPV13383.1 hypothetical protein CLAFUW4_04872 [Fulvia fulva]WPV29290.1 hypothetical protein CLAFUW7_04866 [Fulvia fulva]
MAPKNNSTTRNGQKRGVRVPKGTKRSSKTPVTPKQKTPPSKGRSAIKKGEDRPISKFEERRAVKLQRELDGIITDMRQASDIYGSLLRDIVTVRGRLEDLTDIILCEQTIGELREASKSLREDEPEVWKKLVPDVVPDLVFSPSPSPSPKPKVTPSGKRKADDGGDVEFKTPSKKPKVVSPTLTAASSRPRRTTTPAKTA